MFRNVFQRRVSNDTPGQAVKKTVGTLGALAAGAGFLTLAISTPPTTHWSGEHASNSAVAAQADSTTEVLKFDVAENMSKFIFDDAPVLDNGMPAYGNSFITEGYIYEYGTINGSNGILPNGDPEFPDKVIGRWVCRGWFSHEDGAAVETGEMVITTQVYNFGGQLGARTLVSEGYELIDIEQEILRAITGGTGEYAGVSGQASQQLLGLNSSEGVNLRLELEVEKRPQS